MGYLIASGIFLVVIAAGVFFIMLLDKYTTVMLTLLLLILGIIFTTMVVYTLGKDIEDNRQECGSYFCMEGERE